MAASPVELHRKIRFIESSIGKKVVVAISGLILYGYVVGHLAGNLSIYEGAHAINSYAVFLHSHPGWLWCARTLLFVAVVLHIGVSGKLWLLKRSARPIGYVKKKNVPPAYASARMMITGPLIAFFVIFHVLHLTTGSLGLPYRSFVDVHYNLESGFHIWWVAGAYIFAMLVLAMHLYHGFWSMFQTVGVNHPMYNVGLKRLAHILAILIAAGFISIPAGILVGVIQ